MRLILGAEFKIRGGLRDRISRCATRFERHEVEHRLNLNEAAQVRRLRRFAASQCAPGEACGPAGNNIFRCSRGHAHRSGHVVERQRAALHPRDSKRQRVECSPQARIGCQGFQEDICSRQLVRHPCDLIGRQVQQAVPREKTATLDLTNGMNELGTRCESVGQFGSSLLDELGRRRINYYEDLPLRERFEESLLPLAPRQIGRDKHFGVGSDGKMRSRVGTGTCRQNRSRPDHPPWMMGAEIDDTDDERFQHVWPLTGRIRSGPRRAWGDPSAAD
jgi:hypothetical protein